MRRPVNEATLQEIIRRIVQVAQPERIILFGSAARGEYSAHGDIDLLVVKRGEYNPYQVAGDIYRNLHGIGQAVDVVLVTPEQLEEHRNTDCLIVAPALREGREVYRATAISTVTHANG